MLSSVDYPDNKTSAGFEKNIKNLHIKETKAKVRIYGVVWKRLLRQDLRFRPICVFFFSHRNLNESTTFYKQKSGKPA